MTVFRVIYVFLWCSIHFADCKHRTWLVTQILGIPFQLWIWHDSSQPKLWFLQTWMKIKFLGSEGGGCPPSKPLAIESSCLFLASNRGRPQEYHIMDSGALLTFTRTVSILVKQPPPVRKRMDEEKCSGPNCRSDDAISRYRSIQVPLHSDAIRYGWDGIASDSQVELVNQPPTCRQLRKGKSLESGRTAVSYQKWNNPVYFLLNLSCVHLLVDILHLGLFNSHRQHWITLCVFQQINSAQRLRCQPHQRDQSSQRFVDSLHIGIQPMTNWLHTSWWFRLDPFHKPSKTAKNKAKTTPSSNTPWTNKNQQHLTCRNHVIYMLSYIWFNII